MEVISPTLPNMLPSNNNNKIIMFKSQSQSTLTAPTKPQLPLRVPKPKPKPSPISNNNPSRIISSRHSTSDILRLMDSLSLPIPPDIYASLVKECALARHSRGAIELHSHINKSGIKPSLSLLNRLLLMHVSCGHLDIARQLFDQMFLRDFNSWAIIIVGYLQAGDFEQAIACFVEMERRDFMFKFPRWIIVSVLKSCVLAKNLELGKQLHGQLIKMGVGNDVSLSGSLINFYGKFECLEEANFVFNQLLRHNTVTWTARIANSCREDQLSKVIDDFNEMGRQGVKKNRFTFSSIFKACARMDDGGISGHQVHATAIKLGLESDVFVQCGLIHMYGQCGLVSDAEMAFEFARDKRNAACWNAMLCGYVHNKLCVKAIRLLYWMKEEGFKVQESLLNDVRIACASTNMIDKVK